MTTINDIAQIAGVSRATVYRVIRNLPGTKAETEKLVRKVIEETGFKPSTAAQMLAARKHGMRLAFIAMEFDNENFHQDVLAGAKKQAAALAEYNVQVDFCFYREGCDMETFLHNILESRPDGIATQPMPIPSFAPFMDNANKAGIPVVFYNMDTPSLPRLSYTGCDYFQAGRMAASLVCLMTSDGGETAIFNGCVAAFDAVSSYTDRLSGFLSELAKQAPHIHLAQEGTPFCYDESSTQEVEQWIMNHPALQTVYIVNEGTPAEFVPVVRRLHQGGIRVIMNDLMPTQKKLIKEGCLTATIEQQPEQQGSNALQILFDYIAYGKRPQDKFLTELRIILPSMVEE